MTPRPYQIECLNANAAAFSEFDRVLDSIPTGGGKTIVFALEAQKRLERGKRTLILAHRDELIDQAIAKIQDATGIRAEKEKAECVASLNAPVVVASIQTMQRRLDKWPTDHFGLVVCDEAHHALSDSWQEVLKHFGSAQVLGVTATPDRGDRRNLGQYFETVGYEVGLFKTGDARPGLVDMGYLSPIAVKTVPLRINLSTVKQSQGDYDAASLGDALEPYLSQIAQAIKQHASFRRVLAFLPLIATSHKFVAACRAAGLSAQHIDGESPDRKEIQRAFRNWDFDVLSNAMLLTEGYDDPGIDCIVVLRPTRSTPLFTQMVGRGTRLSDGKENLLLLDLLWMHEKHRICRPAHLIAHTDEEAEAITEIAQEKAAGLPADIACQCELELSGLASEASAKREEVLRKKLEEASERKAKYVSAEAFAVQHGRCDLASWEPTMGWEGEPPTEKQLKYLKSAKIDVETVKSKGLASKLLSLHFASKGLKLASPAMRYTMKSKGCQNWQTATEREARQFFAGLRKPDR